MNSYPASLWAAGWQGIWASIYGIWSAIFFLTHGRPIYPFMDVKRPNAWVGYAFLVLMAWTAHGTVQAGIALREKVHAWMGLAPKKEG